MGRIGFIGGCFKKACPASKVGVRRAGGWTFAQMGLVADFDSQAVYRTRPLSFPRSNLALAGMSGGRPARIDPPGTHSAGNVPGSSKSPPASRARQDRRGR